MASRLPKHLTTSKQTRIYDPWDLRCQAEAVNDGGVQHAQTTIYTIFITLAKTWAPDDVLSLFRKAFIHCVDSSDSNLAPALYHILKVGKEKDFHYTLNRVCYILINNWETARNPNAILNLITILESATDIHAGSASPLRTLRKWLTTFLKSQAFKDLKLFTSRYTHSSHSSHWTHRYTSYLLASQSLNQNNPDEQRSVANVASGEIKREFKRNLAMYAIQSERANASTHILDNPTLLGEHILPLIKKILTKKGEFSCQNLANIFLAQSENVKFKRFKYGLTEYLLFSMGSEGMTAELKTQLSQYLNTLYTHYDDRPIDGAIRLRTANQVINFFTLDKQGIPAPIMTLLLSKGYALTLAILLLKVIMISPNSRRYLEGKIGNLVTYYSELPEAECQWLIKFLEILKVTFTIYSDQRISYNLVSVAQASTHKPQTSHISQQTGQCQRQQRTSYPQYQAQEKEARTSPKQSSESPAPECYRIFSCHVPRNRGESNVPRKISDSGNLE